MLNIEHSKRHAEGTVPPAWTFV